MSSVKDLLTKRKAEAEGTAQWREVTVEEKRKAAERLIREAEILQNTAKADREEAAQCDLALKALETQDRLSELETLYATVGETLSRWRSREIGLDECQAAIIRAHDKVGVG